MGKTRENIQENKKEKFPWRTDERDTIKKMIEEYGTNPFTGKCYVEQLHCKYDRNKKIYNIQIPSSIFEKHLSSQGFEDRDVPSSDTYTNITYVYMIKPIKDDDYVILRKI